MKAAPKQEIDGEGILDLSKYVTQEEFLSGGAHSDIFTAKFSNLPSSLSHLSESELPEVVVKVMRLQFGREKITSELRSKVCTLLVVGCVINMSPCHALETA